MLVLDEDALICDMAETYHIYDIKSLPLPYLATLASGLGMDSRIRLKADGLKTKWSTVMLAALLEMYTKGDKNELLSRFIVKEDKGIKLDGKVFVSVEEFETARAVILGEDNG